MQDYFKYDKIQGGAPLRMKSDSDGVTDGQDSTTPLGIKTTAEGIKHFTNWDDISNSLDAQNKARFDDTQPNALKFSMNNARAVFKDMSQGTYPILMHGGDQSNDNPFYKRRQSRVEFEDRWDAEDITILDDMAFVSYPDYTDIHRVDVQLKTDDVQLQQLAYFDDEVNTQGVHSTLRLSSQLNLQEVLSLGSDDTTDYRSLDFTSLDNSILKIKLTKGADGRLSYNHGAEQFSDQPSGGTSTTTTPEVLYFVYGGVLENSTGVTREHLPDLPEPYADFPTGTPYLGETDTQFDRTTISLSSDKSPLQDINGNAISGEKNKQVVGKFYLVPFGNTLASQTYKIPTSSLFGIQLDITSRWAEDIADIGEKTLTPILDGDMYCTGYCNYIPDPPGRWAIYGGASSRHAAVSHGVSTPTDAQYIGNSIEQGNGDETIFLGVGDVPADFTSVTYISVKIREKVGEQMLPGSDAWNCGVRYQIFKADGTTALTNQIVKTGEEGYTHPDLGYFRNEFTDRTLSFTHTGITDPESWDGALLKLVHFDAQGADTTYFVSEIELVLEYSISTAAARAANYLARKELFPDGVVLSSGGGGGGTDTGSFKAYTVDTEDITLIKITPVRKCGKVDIYTRKRGIIDAVVGNITTSPGHTLNTNDVVEISAALFDGSQAGYADIHPMNGKKFVRKIDDDTFEIFDDQFFQDQTDTSFLRSTMGINWICISSNYGAIGQSWDYYSTIFSPAGRNGYISGVEKVAAGDSLSSVEQFITNKRIGALEATDPNPLGSRTSGVVNLDFRNSFDNPDFAKVIDESVPQRFGTKNPLSNFQYGPQDFYPYYCSNMSDQPLVGIDSDSVKSEESDGDSLYTTTAYDGCRFGSALDIKFSHIDGDSKVYTLAVGERGSDISVDLFGVEQSECHIDTFAQTSNPSAEYINTVRKHGRVSHYKPTTIFGRGLVLTENFRKRPMPWYLPYGKTHVLTVTIDRYGKISDISHVNTLFGGGDDILHADDDPNLQSFRETNPWKQFERAERSFYPVEDQTLPARSYEARDLFQESTYWQNLKNQYTSKYWLRAAVLHWYPQDIYDYKFNRIVSDFSDASKVSRVRAYNHNSYTAIIPVEETGAPYNITMPIVRRDVTSTNAGNSYSSMCRFGYSGFTFTASTPNFFEINRFNNSINLANPETVRGASSSSGPDADSNDIPINSQWYLFPWVDSFGKSVALQHITDGVCVLSGCRARANEELDAGYQDIAGLNPFPLQPTNNSQDRALPRLTEPETQSKIGHINIAILNNTSFSMLEFNELNSGGPIFTRNFQSGNDILLSTTADGDTPAVDYVKLPIGTDAGFGMPEVINSTELSNSKIVWKDNYILFAEQDLYNSRSLLHVFKYDHTNGFSKDDEISVPFIDVARGGENSSAWIRNVSPAYNVGDGFGLDFRYDKDLLVSNGMRAIDQLGDDMGLKMASNELGLYGQISSQGASRIDTLSVYERRQHSGQRKLKFVQNIYPSIDIDNKEQYPPSLTTALRNSPITDPDNTANSYNYKYLVPLDTLTYDNSATTSLVWNINWQGRYDVTGTKIIIKDPLEYSLYTSTFVDRFIDPTLDITATSINLSPYLTFTEQVEAKTDSLSSFAKYTYDNVSIFTSSDTCGGGWVTGRDKSITNTPVMFFNVPMDGLDVLDSLTITFDISNQNALTQRWLRASSTPESITSNTLAPRIVLYKKDPRSTIILNGPSDAGFRETYFPHYANGIFKTIPRATDIDLSDPDSSAHFSTGSDQLGMYNDQHQAFFRGGAADLFFYGTLPVSVVSSAQQDISNAMAAGYPDTSLPFYYGGGNNLGEYFDLTYGSHSSAGFPAWISNDTLDGPFLQDDQLAFSIKRSINTPLIFSNENLALIEPYAKLFAPTTINGNSVSLTISATDLRDFLIDGSLIKSSSDDRSVFGNRPTGTEYPEIYNDTLASPGFNDINKASYTPLDHMSKTLAIGFVMTNISSHTIGSDPTAESIASAYGNQAFRTINRGQADSLNPVTGEKRYPYSAIANQYTGDIKETSAVLDFDFSTDVSNININASIRSVKPTRYSNKFHKIAIFDYHQEASDDVRASMRYDSDGSIGFGNTQFIEPFARSKFSPLTIGLSNPTQNINRPSLNEYNFNYALSRDTTYKNQYDGVLQSQNSVVRFSNTSNAPLGSGVMISSTVQDSRGSYAKSIQILNSENLIYNDSSYYVDVDDNTPAFILPPAGHILGKALFGRSSLLGGFDIYDPEFVSLFAVGGKDTKKFADSFITGMEVAKRNSILKTGGIEGFAYDMPLKMGIASAASGIPLFIKSPEFNTMSLFTTEVQPDEERPLYTSGPDIDSSISLLLNTPVNGERPLYTQGPIQFQAVHPFLYTRGMTGDNFHTDLFMPTVGVGTGNPSLFTRSLFSSGIPPLFTKTPEPSTNNADLFIKVREPFNLGADLYVDPIGHASGLPSLATKGPISLDANTSLFTGDHGVDEMSSLYIDTVRPLDSNTHLLTQSFIYTSDSNSDGDGELILRYRNGLLLQADKTETPVVKTISNTDAIYNVQELSSNSITYPTLFDIDGVNSALRFPDSLNGQLENRNFFMGTHDKQLTNTTTTDINLPSTFDPAYHTTRVGSRNKLYTWYKDLASPPNPSLSAQTAINRPKMAVRDDMFASNGKYVVVASEGHIFSNSATGGMIAIYKINTDGSLSFDTRLNTVYFDFKKAAASSAVLGTVGGVDIVDGFHSLRQELFELVTGYDAGTPRYPAGMIQASNNALDYTDQSRVGHASGTKVRILQVAISKQNKCAISLRCYFAGNDGQGQYQFRQVPIAVIVEFDILDYIDSEQGFATNQVTASFHYCGGISAFGDFFDFYGNSLSYCGETLYYSGKNFHTNRDWDVSTDSFKNRIAGEHIYTKTNSTTSAKDRVLGYGIETIGFEPNTIPDAQLYIDRRAHLPRPYENFTGFGYVVKCFDRYETNDKIIFVSAPLFDPYLNNTLPRMPGGFGGTVPVMYSINPMGAVYIFIQSLGSTDWTYQGAVYAKGYTSSNITSNLDQYKNGQLNDEFALFGYDLDYKQDVLVVSEPGGNSAGTTNKSSAGRCYRFDVTDPAVPVLLNTYEAANLRKDPVDTASAAIGVNDNFGSSVVLFNDKDVITWSDANIRKEIIETDVGKMTVFKNDSILYNLNTGRYFGFQDNAGDNYGNNILNEVKQYFPFELLNISSDQITVSSRILVMKELKFGDSTKLGVLREFSVKSPILNSSTSRFKIHKLSIIEPDKINGLTLFIKGPIGAVSDMPLVTDSIGLTNVESTLIIPGHFDADSSHSLYLENKWIANNTPLYLHTDSEIFSPLYQLGGVISVDNDTRLVISVPNMDGDTSLNTAGITSDIFTTDLKIAGTVAPADVAPTPLYIGQEAHKNNFTDLFITNLYNPPDGGGGTAAGKSHDTSIAISGGLTYTATTEGVSPPFFMTGPDSASGVLSSPLYITTDIPPTGEGGKYLNNTNINLVMPVDETVVPVALDNTLFIKQRATKTETTDLYIARNLPVATTVFVSGVGMGSGIMPLSIEATHIDNEDISLIIRPLPELGMNLTSRGFVE